MDMAFVGVSAVKGATGKVSRVSVRPARRQACRQAGARMVAINASDYQAETDPVSQFASTIIGFMNQEHKQDLVQYILKYGDSDVEEVDPTNIDDIALRNISKNGMTIDVIMCENDDQRCVCIQQDIAWVENAICTTIDDICESLTRMSKACGLNTEF